MSCLTQNTKWNELHNLMSSPQKRKTWIIMHKNICNISIYTQCIHLLSKYINSCRQFASVSIYLFIYICISYISMPLWLNKWINRRCMDSFDCGHTLYWPYKLHFTLIFDVINFSLIVHSNTPLPKNDKHML